MARMVGAEGHVLGIDIIPALVELSVENVNKDDESLLGRQLQLRIGSGWEALEGEQLFNAIHVGAAADSVPRALLSQLAPGGRMGTCLHGEVQLNFNSISILYFLH